MHESAAAHNHNPRPSAPRAELSSAQHRIEELQAQLIQLGQLSPPGLTSSASNERASPTPPSAGALPTISPAFSLLSASSGAHMAARRPAAASPPEDQSVAVNVQQPSTESRSVPHGADAACSPTVAMQAGGPSQAIAALSQLASLAGRFESLETMQAALQDLGRLNPAGGDPLLGDVEQRGKSSSSAPAVVDASDLGIGGSGSADTCQTVERPRDQDSGEEGSAGDAFKTCFASSGPLRPGEEIGPTPEAVCVVRKVLAFDE